MKCVLAKRNAGLCSQGYKVRPQYIYFYPYATLEFGPRYLFGVFLSFISIIFFPKIAPDFLAKHHNVSFVFGLKRRPLTFKEMH